MPETLRIETDARGVATLTLDRAERHNALSETMIAELTQAAERLGADPAVRAVVLTGAGRSFCAGADIAGMPAQLRADRAGREAEARALWRMLAAWEALPRPLIGRINGQAYGGGAALMAVCDVALGAAEARFGFTEVRLGLVPAVIAPFAVARMGPATARRVLFSGRVFGAGEAVTLGLLARAVPAGELDAAVEAEVAPYMDAAPEAVAAGKALVRRLGPPIDGALEAEMAGRMAEVWDSASAAEGVAAFLEKRAPVWPDGGG